VRNEAESLGSSGIEIKIILFHTKPVVPVNHQSIVGRIFPGSKTVQKVDREVELGKSLCLIKVEHATTNSLTQQAKIWMLSVSISVRK
jgi:hypothetical protein